MPVRIYELAKEFDLPNKQVIEVCRELNILVKSHSSTVEEDEAAQVRRRLAALVGETAEPEPEPAAAAPPQPPQQPQLSPEEQLALARSRHIVLPTRGPVKPKAEGVKLSTVRRRPPARPGEQPPEQAPPAEAAAPAAVAEAPAPPPVEAPQQAAPVAETPAPEAPPLKVQPQPEPATAPEPPREAAEAAAEAPASPLASVESPPAPPPVPAPAKEMRERVRPVRKPPGPKLAQKPVRAGPKLAPKPKPHPQAVKEVPAAPEPHPQAVGVRKKPPTGPKAPRMPVPAAGPLVPPVLAATEEAAVAERRGKRKGGKKAVEEETEGIRKAHAFRRRERQRQRDDVDEIIATTEITTGGGVVGERARLSKAGRPITSRPARPKPAVPEGPHKVVVEMPVTVKSLSAALGVKASEIIQHLMTQGVMATVNAALTEEQVLEIAMARDIEIEIRHERAPADALREIENRPDPPETLKPRPPVVTFLGHVDHGKTSLMDFIRKTHVAAGEAGGITQHIGAYRVHLGDRWITFLDTPGHAAFTAMRARGAKVTDVAVLVVAADDGVMPQTEEAVNHAKAAEVPIVVAINKCDLPQANPQRVKQQLTQFGLVAEEWGGQTICVETSAVTGQNVDKLLESLLLEAEMRELRANPDRPALGTVIEAQLTEGFGPLATLLVQKGTLRPGDVVLAGTAYGRVRALTDENGRRMREAGPSVPVRVAGLSGVPEAGDRFYVLESLSLAKQLADERERQLRESALAEQRRPRTLEAVFDQMTRAEVKELALIIKADVQGSVEALKENLEKIEHPEVRVKIIHAATGGVNESDVLLADASNAVIIGFNVVPDASARALAEQRGVTIRHYRIIYDVTDDIRKALEGLLAPQEQEKRLGGCEVIQTFKISRVGTVAGCRVTDGVITRSARVRLVRDGAVVHTGTIQSLKRLKDDVREARSGQECGIHLAGYDDVKVGDRIEAFEIVSVARTL